MPRTPVTRRALALAGTLFLASTAFVATAVATPASTREGNNAVLADKGVWISLKEVRIDVAYTCSTYADPSGNGQLWPETLVVTPLQNGENGEFIGNATITPTCDEEEHSVTVTVTGGDFNSDYPTEVKTEIFAISEGGPVYPGGGGNRVEQLLARNVNSFRIAPHDSAS